MFHRLICALHISAALLLCASPMLSGVGQEFFSIEYHSDADDSGKDAEDENETKDFIYLSMSTDPNSIPDPASYQVQHVPGMPVNEHMDVFTPPPEM